MGTCSPALAKKSHARAAGGRAMRAALPCRDASEQACSMRKCMRRGSCAATAGRSITQLCPMILAHPQWEGMPGAVSDAVSPVLVTVPPMALPRARRARQVTDWNVRHLLVTDQRYPDPHARQVTDWEAGGRTGPAHAERIFCKERPASPQAVLAVMHMCAGQAER